MHFHGGFTFQGKEEFNKVPHTNCLESASHNNEPLRCFRHKVFCCGGSWGGFERDYILCVSMSPRKVL